MKYSVASCTDVGLVRQNNEDSFLVEEEIDLFVVADGMGGYQKGEVASEITCTSIRDHLKSVYAEYHNISKKDFIDAVQKANDDIRKRISETANLERMGSTVIALLMRKDCFLIANVGDSRAYRFREKELVQISVDHSLIQETKAAGIKKELAPQFKNIVTRAMGMKEAVVPDIYAEHSQNGDMFLLCSDGLHGFVTDAQISEVLAFGNDIEAHVKALIQAAKDGGGKDNITCILLRIEEQPEEEGKPLSDTFQIPLYKMEDGTDRMMTTLQWILLVITVVLVGFLVWWYATVAMT